jgi:ribosomal protein S18 acetylase RimI-like enzyme
VTGPGRAVRVRAARPEEWPAIGELTARVYRTGGFTPAGHPYLATLRDAGARAGAGELLLAEDESGRLLGSATLVTGTAAFADPAAGPDDATLRMLVVDPAGRRAGVGAALVRDCIDRAQRRGARVLWLSTEPEMHAARRLYERLGFARTPEHDWTPIPGVRLLTYALRLGPSRSAGYSTRAIRSPS